MLMSTCKNWNSDKKRMFDWFRSEKRQKKGKLLLLNTYIRTIQVMVQTSEIVYMETDRF